jgi:hypothetical protein
MLVHLNNLAGKSLNNKDVTQIRGFAGGHAGLLKAVFDIWIEEPPQDSDVLSYLASKPDVQQECRRILVHLHEQERQAAVLVARKQHTQDHQDTIDHLVRRGLLSESGAWFSPLFERCLLTYEG